MNCQSSQKISRIRKNAKRRAEQGFTLIELLVIIGILGILSMLGITSFGVYKASAGYAVSQRTLMDARNAFEASVSDPDNPPNAVPLFDQTAYGAISDVNGAAALPGFYVPHNIAFQFEYDPTCMDSVCPYEAFLQVNHCLAQEYTSWTRYGDGVEILLEHVAGGCP